MDKMSHSTDYSKKKVLIWTIVWIPVIMLALEIFFRSGFIWQFSELRPYFNTYLPHFHNSAFEISKIKHTDLDNYDQYFVLLGGSASGICSIYSDKKISKILCKKTGKKIGFTSIVGPNASFATFDKIIRELKDKKVTFILGIESTYLTNDISKALEEMQANSYRFPKFYFLPVSSDMGNVIKHFGGNVPLTQKIISINSLHSLCGVLKNVFEKILHHERMGNYDRSIGLNTPTTINELEKRHKERYKPLTSYKKDSKANLAMLDTLLTYCKRNSIDIIAFEFPINDITHQIYLADPDRAQAYKDMAKAFKEHGIYYMDFYAHKHWPYKLYVDERHFCDAGRNKFEPLFTTYLINYLKVENLHE